MAYLPQIKITDVEVFRSVSDAPVGAVLQISAAGLPEAAGQDPAIAVLRAQIPTFGGNASGLVILDGQWAGVFVTDDELGFRPAIDITKLAEIVLVDPSPLAPMHHRLVPGDVCQGSIRDEPPFLVMVLRFATSQQASPDGYVHLVP